MSAVRRSIGYSMVDKYLSQMLAIATTAVMARLLTPAETGLYLTANAFILLADNFRLYGIGLYIVQEAQVSRTLLRSAFTVTLVLSLVCGCAIFLGADYIAAFYETPELGRLFAVGALGFLAAPFSSPIIALLQRDLAFRALACINIGSALVGFAVTVALGVAGIGALSYVWGSVAAGVTVLVMACVVRPTFGIFRPSLAGVSGVLSFGMWSTLVTVANQAYDLLPRLAFGKILGFDGVGLFSRALTISQLPDRVLTSALQPVVLPALAAHIRAGGNAKASYLSGLTLMSAVQWPALIMVALLADPIVHVLLGSQWHAAAPLVRVMAIANMACVPGFITFPTLVAAGRIRHALYSSLIILPPSILIVVGASFIGLEAVAASLLIVAPLETYVGYLFVRRAIGLTFAEAAAAFRQSAWLTIGTALLPGLVVATSGRGFDLGWGQTLMAIAGGGVGWLAAIHLVGHPLKHELAAIASGLSGLLSRRRTAALSRRRVATTAE